MAQSLSAEPIATTICAIVRTPRAFDGKVVRFRAGVWTDWHHGTFLVHDGCKSGIALLSTEAVPHYQSDALDSAVGNPMTGGNDRMAMATFTGKFSWKPGKRGGWLQNPTRQFDAYAIRSIKVYSRRMTRR